ncbi:MAG: hypothetical protein HY288_00025 [Planctomycetia bacterium]|nr:hypothetical protein [Planctomycetia bacterium]
MIVWNRLALLGLAGQAAVVSGIVAIVWLLAAPVAYEISGVRGLVTAACGATVCLIGAQLALFITSLFRGSSAAMYALVLAMLARTIIPLLLGVVLHRQVPALAQAGIIFYLLVFYMATLATETVLMLAHVQSSSTS